MKRACKNCQWWEARADTDWGHCHGLPEFAAPVGENRTDRDDWCGLFRASEAKIREAG